MKISSGTVLQAVILAVMTFLMPTVSSASETTTRLCINISQKHGGSDSTNIYVKLRGTNASTRAVVLNNPGINDFVKGKWSCFNLTQASLGGDVGFHNTVELGFNSGDQDDFCFTNIQSSRYQNGKIVSTSKFGGREECLGDYAGSQPVLTFSATNQPVKKKVTAGKATARWVEVCKVFCNHTVSNSITVGNATESGTSKETTTAISATLETGVEFPGGSASMSLTTSEEKSIGQSFSRSMSREESSTREVTVELSRDEMRDQNIFAVWQWVAETRLSTNEVARVGSLNYTCTSGPQAPRYLPSSPEHVASCSQEKKQEISELDATKLEIAKLQLAELKRKLEAENNNNNGAQQPAAPAQKPAPVVNQPTTGVIPGSGRPASQPIGGGATSLQSVRVIKGDRIGITSVSYSPDGRYIISGGWENTLKYWDAKTGKSVSSINMSGKGDLLLDAMFNPTGNRIVTGSRDYDARLHTVNVFDVGNGQSPFALDQMPPDICDDASFSPNGRLIAAGCFDGKSGARTVQLWNASNGRTAHIIRGVNGPASFSADSLLVTGGDGARNTLKLWNTQTGQLQASVTGFGFNVVKFSPNNSNVIAGGGYNGLLKMFLVSSNSEAVNYQGHTDTINGIAFSPNGQLIVSGSKDKSVRVWDAGSGRQLGAFTTPGEVESVAFSPSGNQVVSGGMGGTINILNISR